MSENIQWTNSSEDPGPHHLCDSGGVRSCCANPKYFGTIFSKCLLLSYTYVTTRSPYLASINVNLNRCNSRFYHFLKESPVISSVVCSYHQFSLVFANVGGVTGVWPWTKVKKYHELRSRLK